MDGMTDEQVAAIFSKYLEENPEDWQWDMGLLAMNAGLRGRAERGLAAGGLPYGYRTKLAPGADASAKHPPKKLVVVEDPAAVVRRIFELYASGEALRSISHRLNAEGIPAPRGKGRALSALQVILENSIYRGEYVWNRSEWIKDRETGRRRPGVHTLKAQQQRIRLHALIVDIRGQDFADTLYRDSRSLLDCQGMRSRFELNEGP
jgi:hypothetical protein